MTHFDRYRQCQWRSRSVGDLLRHRRLDRCCARAHPETARRARSRAGLLADDASRATQRGYLLGAGLVIVIWLWLWTGFYRLDVSPSAVTFTWLLPTRQTTIGRDAIDSARWEPGLKGSRYLVITTHDGRRFRSAQTRISRDDEAAISLPID